ncbi:MAG: RNA-binding protein [Spirochaetaceae bacterium]|nr:RNA-binding protein [Spirochaetaceae bacterium]
MSNKIYVGNMNYQTREEHLRSLFEAYGEVLSIHFVKDRETGRFRGFAFVELDSPEAVADAERGLDGKEVDGRQLRVKKADERPPRPNNNRERHYDN